MQVYKEYTLQHKSPKGEIITNDAYWKRDLEEVKRALKYRLLDLTGMLNGFVNADGSPRSGIPKERVEAWKMEKATVHIVERTVTISEPVALTEGK